VSAMKLEDLLDNLWFSATSSTEKGSAFERLMASYLRTAPEFADRFEEVYLWQDWPGRAGAHDHGIDIVAKDITTGGWCAVQCKFYDPTHHVAKSDIDSFLAASSKRGFTSRIIVSTAKDWGKTIEQQLDNLTVTVVRIGVNDLMESKVDWSHIDWTTPQQVLPTTGKKTALPHRREARTKVREGLTTHDRGQLIMACGTGKTFTALKIAEELATGRKAEPTTALFLVPSIQLLNQSLREWKQESQIPFRAYAVCSDTAVGKTNASEDLSVHDLIYPATTDTEALAAQIRKRTEDDQFTVVFSTYHSIDVVAKAQGQGMPEFDLIICDEAHRTTGVTLADADESHFVRVHDNTYLKGVKRLYMTATPRLFDPNTKEKAQANDAVLASTHGDWLNQRRGDFEQFVPLGQKGMPSVFDSSCPGLQSNRDAWVYNFDHMALRANMKRTIATYKAERIFVRKNQSHTPTTDPTLLSWSSSLQSAFARDRPAISTEGRVREAMYRPYSKSRLFLSRMWNHRPALMPQLFPAESLVNQGMYLTGPSAAMAFTVIAVNSVPDQALYGAQTNGQFFPRWTFSGVDGDGTLSLVDQDEVVDGYCKIDNITHEALRRFRAAYGDSITKDDCFFYVYGLLHSPEYRETYAADLKKMLPRIPLVEDAQPFIDAGRKLSELHLGYESVTPYPLDGLDVEAEASSAAYDVFRVEKMRFGKPTGEQKAAGERNDRTTIVYNDRITLSGIPEAAYRYMLGSRSAIEWIMDRYQVKTDKASGIVNDPNDWSREVEDPRYIIDLLARIVTVSLETMQIVDSLPPLAIRADQGGA